MDRMLPGPSFLPLQLRICLYSTFGALSLFCKLWWPQMEKCNWRSFHFPPSLCQAKPRVKFALISSCAYITGHITWIEWERMEKTFYDWHWLGQKKKEASFIRVQCETDTTFQCTESGILEFVDNQYESFMPCGYQGNQSRHGHTSSQEKLLPSPDWVRVSTTIASTPPSPFEKSLLIPPPYTVIMDFSQF